MWCLCWSHRRTRRNPELSRSIRAYGGSEHQANYLLATKSDEVQDVPRKPEWASQVVQVSAQTGDGMESLQKALIESANFMTRLEMSSLTTKRQLELATLAKGHITQAITLLGSGTPRDIVLVELESAAKQLTRITGADTNDAMIADMFSRFCIGK
jgi:tRNA modification GTPase